MGGVAPWACCRLCIGQNIALWSLLAAIGSWLQCQQMCWYLQFGNEQVGDGLWFQSRHICGGRGRPSKPELFCLELREATGVGAQSHSLDLCVKLKQYLHRLELAWPAKALFQSVGSILAHMMSGVAAAICQKWRSYPSHPSPSYSIRASTTIAW